MNKEKTPFLPTPEPLKQAIIGDAAKSMVAPPAIMDTIPAAKVAAPATVDQLFGAMHDTAMVVGKVDNNSTVALLYNRDTFKLKATWKKQDQAFQFTSRSISPGTPVPTILDIITEFGVQLVERVK